MTIMAIYFVRHGKDEDGFLGGWSQRGLIEQGFEQSQLLGQYLKEHHDTFTIHQIISSDLTRALETANCIGEILQLPVETSHHWRETNNGMLAGMPESEARKQFPGLSFNRLKMDERYPGGESPIENFTRIKLAFEELCNAQLENNHQENLLVVTHGGVINIIYHIIKKKKWTNKNSFFPISNTSIHRIEYLNNQWAITLENSVEHLN